jgi:hypothetical protein
MVSKCPKIPGKLKELAVVHDCPKVPSSEKRSGVRISYDPSSSPVIRRLGLIPGRQREGAGHRVPGRSNDRREKESNGINFNLASGLSCRVPGGGP